MTVEQIEAKEALKILESDENSVLIDVRTFEEFNFVGCVNSFSFDDRIIMNPWKLLPAMSDNPEFDHNLEDALSQAFGDKSKEVKLFFLCRSGGRSNAAANHSLNLGYKNCYNIIGGFEGKLDENEQRGNVDGWKASNLPWRQN